MSGKSIVGLVLNVCFVVVSAQLIATWLGYNGLANTLYFFEPVIALAGLVSIILTYFLEKYDDNLRKVVRSYMAIAGILFLAEVVCRITSCPTAKELFEQVFIIVWVWTMMLMYISIITRPEKPAVEAY